MWFLQSVKITSMMRENLFAQDCHRTGYSWIRSIDAENQFVMVMWLVMWCMMKNRFLVMVLVLDVDLKNNRMTNGLGYDFDECGRFSISSWLVCCPTPRNRNKPKINPISKIFNLDQSFLLSTTRNHSDSHLEPPCVIFGSYGLKYQFSKSN